MKLPIAVLVSGRGSNLQAILDACASDAIDARVAIVISNHAGVPVINLHPALLPLFGGRGMHGDKVHAAVLASGASESGCTVHRVHPETVDLGEVVVQRRVPVLPNDDPAKLAARVLEQEHVAIVEAIRKLASARAVEAAQPLAR